LAEGLIRRGASPAKRSLSISDFDLIISGGTVATASDTFKADVGIRGGPHRSGGGGPDRRCADD
jgi:hypothetical protein